MLLAGGFLGAVAVVCERRHHVVYKSSDKEHDINNATVQLPRYVLVPTERLCSACCKMAEKVSKTDEEGL